MALEPRFKHDGRTWGLTPADAERLADTGLIVLVETDETDATDEAHPVYDLAEGHLLMEVDDFLVPLDHAARRVAERDGAPPIFSQRPRR
jgi:hypothetical protein